MTSAISRVREDRVGSEFETAKRSVLADIEAGDHMKKDHGKAPWHLMPYDALKGAVLVLAFGAKKYRERGWEKGMDWSRVYSATQRHLVAWWHKEGVDPDTGYSHLWHALCCVLFLTAYEMRNKGNDDRPSNEREQGPEESMEKVESPSPEDVQLYLQLCLSESNSMFTPQGQFKFT